MYKSTPSNATHAPRVLGDGRRPQRVAERRHRIQHGGQHRLPIRPPAGTGGGRGGGGTGAGGGGVLLFLFCVFLSVCGVNVWVCVCAYICALHRVNIYTSLLHNQHTYTPTSPSMPLAQPMAPSPPAPRPRHLNTHVAYSATALCAIFMVVLCVRKCGFG